MCKVFGMGFFMDEASLNNQISVLLDIRNQLVKCSSISEIIHIAVYTTRKQMHSQVASVYLFSKDDVLERKGIAGVDRLGRPLDSSWFPTERYHRGESFTGKVVSQEESPNYSAPWISNNLANADIDTSSRDIYTSALGLLRCAAAVPINGQHRTYGVLEVINKVDEKDILLPRAAFTTSDLQMLTIISNSIAAAISNLRRVNELQILAEISKILVLPFSGGLILSNACQYITDKLIASTFNYCLSTIRISGYSGDLLLMAWSLDRDYCDELEDNDLIDENEIEYFVYRSGEPKYISSTSNEIELQPFRSRKGCHFKSFACLPIVVDGEKLGVVSLYTMSSDEFQGHDRTILSNVVSLIATLIKAHHVVDELQLTQRQLDRAGERLLTLERQKDRDLWSQEILHRYKQDLITIAKKLERALSESPGRQRDILQEQFLWSSNRISEIENEFDLATRERVNINALVKEIVRQVSFNPALTINVAPYNYIPDIEGNTSILKTILLNVVLNAVKATEHARRRNPEINIKTGIIDANNIRYIQITVQDNGLGIPKEVGNKVFDRGFSTYNHGTGMGLFIVRKILESYGGKMLFDSTVGRGTTFFIRLPLNRNIWRESD